MKDNASYYEKLVHPAEHRTAVHPGATETLRAAEMMLALEVIVA